MEHTINDDYDEHLDKWRCKHFLLHFFTIKTLE
jgi:hypothetical protein